MPVWLSFVIFQFGWTLVVLGSQSIWYWLILVLITALLIYERRIMELSRHQYLARTIFVLIGYGFDSVLINGGIINFESSLQVQGFIFAPIWLLLMWVWFSITLPFCYRWLKDKPLIALVAGGIFGPFAYWAASKLVAVEILQPMAFFPVSACFWALAFGAIFWLPSLYRALVGYRSLNSKT